MHYAKAKYLVVRLRQEKDNLKKTLAVAKKNKVWFILGYTLQKLKPVNQF